MEEKYFRIEWDDGCITYVYGSSIENALVNAGYHECELSNIKTWAEASSLPIMQKEVVILNWDNTPICKFSYNQHTGISHAIREIIDENITDLNLDNDVMEVHLSASLYQYKVSINPFQIVCRLMYYKNGNVVKMHYKENVNG